MNNYNPYINEFGSKIYKNTSGQRHRLDGPAVEYTDGSKQWYINNKLHKLDGPAIENANGCNSWWVNGKLHRLDGPAVEYFNGYKEWCLNGERHINSIQYFLALLET